MKNSEFCWLAFLISVSPILTDVMSAVFVVVFLGLALYYSKRNE